MSSLGEEMTSGDDAMLMKAAQIAERRRARGKSLREHFITYKWNIV